MFNWRDSSEVKAVAALAAVQSSSPSTHIGPLTTAFNSSFRGPKTLFWPPQMHIHVHDKKIKLFFFKKEKEGRRGKKTHLEVSRASLGGPGKAFLETVRFPQL